MPFSASAVFCFISSTSAKGFPLRTFFIQRNKKSRSGQDQVNREGEAQGSCRFWSKTAERSAWAGALINHPTWNGQTHWKSLQKNSLKPNTASHNNTSGYPDVDGFLEHSPIGGSLDYKRPAFQKIIPGGFFGSSLMYYTWIKRFFKEFIHLALAGVAHWIECWPVDWRIASSIPGQGTCLDCGPGP